MATTTRSQLGAELDAKIGGSGSVGGKDNGNDKDNGSAWADGGGVGVVIIVVDTGRDHDRLIVVQDQGAEAKYADRVDDRKESQSRSQSQSQSQSQSRLLSLMDPRRRALVDKVERRSCKVYSSP